MSAMSNATSSYHTATHPSPSLSLHEGHVDHDYTGHLVDVVRHDAHTPDVEEITPFVFDATTVTETRPWWNEIMKDPNASRGIQTAEEMFKVFVDPYAEYRRRVVYSAPSRVVNPPQGVESMLVTPPGQLYQRFEYDDALLRIPDIPAQVKEATTAALPPFSTLDAHVKVEEQDDTPVELIEAAVAALMTHPAGVNAVEHAMWSTPASATFPMEQGHGVHPHHSGACVGPVRSRAHTFGAYYSPDMLTPEAYAMAQGALDEDHVGVDGQHVCLWLGCGQILASPAALTHHVNRYHIARRQPAHRCLWRNCPRADHVFRHRDKILIHIRLHTNDRPWVCDAPACDKTFSRADSLEAHKKVHAAEGKSWQCRAHGCGRMYFHAKSLKKHERSAHGLELEL